MTDNTQDNHNISTHYVAKPNPYKLAIFSLVILLAGLVIGAASTILFLQAYAPEKLHMPGHVTKRMSSELRRNLKLTPEQDQQIKPIIAQHLKNLHEIKSTAAPKIRKELSEMRESISEALTEEQNKKFQRQFKKTMQIVDQKPGQGQGQRQNRRKPQQGQQGSREQQQHHMRRPQRRENNDGPRRPMPLEPHEPAKQE